MKKTKPLRLNSSDVRHLRRLIGYVRCEIGQSPDEMVATVRSFLPKIGEPSSDGKERLVRAHEESRRVPQYVRAAIKALEKLMFDEEGQTVDSECHVEQKPQRLFIKGISP